MTEVIVLAASTVIAGTVWGGKFLVNLWSRQNRLDDRIDTLREVLDERFDSVDGRLERIERVLNGHLREE